MKRSAAADSKFTLSVEIERRRLKRVVSVLDMQMVAARHCDDKEMIAWGDVAEVTRDLVLEAADGLDLALLIKDVMKRSAPSGRAGKASARKAMKLKRRARTAKPHSAAATPARRRSAMHRPTHKSS
jgi:hypothetical protein